MLQQLLAVSCPLFASLLKLHDTTADLPIRRRHQRIDGARTRPVGGFEQSTDAAEQTGVVADCNGWRGFLFRGGFFM
jgi:hypothetical protein